MANAVDLPHRMADALCDLRPRRLRQLPDTRKRDRVRIIVDAQLRQCAGWFLRDMHFRNTGTAFDQGYQARNAAISRVGDFGEQQGDIKAEFLNHDHHPGWDTLSSVKTVAIRVDAGVPAC